MPSAACTIDLEARVTISRQLHDLQTLDLDLRTNEQRQAEIIGQIGDSREVARARQRLDALQQRLEEESKELHSAEWAIDDLSTKLAKVEETLYSGRVRNPKELSGYQQESEELKGRHHKAEDRVLEAMGRAESTIASVSDTTAELVNLEAEWRINQTELSAELEALRSAHADLTQQRAKAVADIPGDAVGVYQIVQKQKGTAVARVEQGTCRGCQISLPTTELQQVRSGSLVRCSSCGRILYLA